MEFDFTKLDGIEKKAPKTPQDSFSGTSHRELLPEKQNGREGRLRASDGIGKLERHVEQKRAEEGMALAVYKRYQENIKISEMLRAEILKGMRSGEKIEALLIKAAKVIGLMVGDDVFYRQVEEGMAARKARG